ncbi:MAG: helix-turn-helix domain-containing protein [Methylococcales bacterium]|nr:helix-turn-helix domain-containing protein [Methylococcales bacterium]
MRKPKFPVTLNDDEREELEKITRQQTAKSSTVLRAKIILLANSGMKYQDIAQKLDVQNNIVTNWTARWHELANKPVRERLQDLPRPGAPDTFTPEQLCQLIALSCEKPEDYGRPITHWTHKELAKEAIKQGIVETISANHLGRILKKTI